MLDVNSILQLGGLIAITLVIFAESGLLLGLFLPGDTLLIAGGVLASEQKLPLNYLIFLTTVATIAGYELAYFLGRRAGPHIFRRKEGILFREDYMAHTEEFFKKHGWKTILISRFIAIVRTIIPLVAGMGRMNRQVFLVFNVIGGLIWSAGLILVSYLVGQKVPNLDKYIQYLVLAAILITWGGLVYELYKKRSRRAEILDAIKEEYRLIFRKPKP